jgi:hypothetical protein
MAISNFETPLTGFKASVDGGGREASNQPDPSIIGN